MSANQYQHEHQVTTIIDTYHREATQAEKIRLARPGRSILTSVRSLFTTAGAYVRQEPIVRPELLNVSSDRALIA